MTDLARRVEDARSSLRELSWTSARSESVRRRIHRKRQRFALSTVALGSAALAVAVAVAIIWFAQGGTAGNSSKVASVLPPTAVSASPLELADGTRAVQLGLGSQVELVAETEELVTYSLVSGKGWFEVKPSASRRVEVKIQDVRVEVLGTEFVIEISGDIVHVWVHRGKVSVTSNGKTVTVRVGEHQTFPARDKNSSERPSPVPSPVLVPVPVPAPTPSPITVRRPEPTKIEADEGKQRPFDTQKIEEEEAIEDLELDDDEGDSFDDEVAQPSAVEKPAPPAPPDRVAQLWRQADEARLSADQGKAIRALTELLGKHDDDPRAALAAFSLGRVLIDADRSAVVAARAFAKARKLAPDGPLVEDALLREIEAWFEAGDKRRVKKRSEKYRRLFPKGRYLKQVRELGEEL